MKFSATILKKSILKEKLCWKNWRLISSERLMKKKRLIWSMFVHTTHAEVISGRFGQKLLPIFMVLISIVFQQELKLQLLIKNAINALIACGFEVKKSDETANPKYEVLFGESKSNLCFSKTIDDESLPKENFVAVMTCGDADENCPFIPGCDLRIGTTYFDPKSYDNSILMDEKYTERSNQIAMECLYFFSLLKK